MPELPEVETIRKDLEKNIIGKSTLDVTFLWEGILKDMTGADFKKIVVGKKFLKVVRRAKNIYVELEDGIFLLFHMKMTGHLIYTDDCWKVDPNGKWIYHKDKMSPMYDPLNQYIRMIFHLTDKKILAFSDLRKFAYLKLLDQKGIEAALAGYGPEPLTTAFSEEYLAEILGKKGVAIKKILMDQALIAGIGNIYADEILYRSKIHPLTPGSHLDKKDIALLYTSIVSILTRAVKMRGTSTSDFRDTEGKRGAFGEELLVYRRTNLPCLKDGTPIERIVVGGRGTHFCPKEQVQK